ncbi:MAG: class I tRNA ligase family protein [Acidobacteriota bacterium]
MPVKKLDPQAFTRQHDADHQDVFPWPDTVRPPFGATWVRLEPGQSTSSNGHGRNDSFFVARGQATITSAGKEDSLGSGDVAFRRAADGYELTNTSSSDELLVLNLHWEGDSPATDGMWVQKLDPSTYLRAYNADLQVVFPTDDISPPFGALWSVIRPGEISKSHAHQECEAFIIVGGKGHMLLGGEEYMVESGDVTFHRPFDEHELTNVSDSEDLFLIDVYWEQKEMWAEPSGELDGEARPLDPEPALIEKAERVLVTSAAPTPNGDLHIGHLSGTYLASDVIARYLNLRGTVSHYTAGTDDNSFFLKSLAESLDQTPEETADHFHRSINETLEMFGVERALTPQPNTKEHIDFVQGTFTRLLENGHIELREEPLWYDETSGRYLFEPYIGGTCAYCGDKIVGHTCESCGWYNDPMQIENVYYTGAGPDDPPPIKRMVKRFYFLMQPWARKLWEHHRDTPSSPRFRAFCEHVIEKGLPDVCITYPSDWGIPVPVPGFEDQRLWSWFELGPRYFNYTRQMAEKLGLDTGWETYWKGENERYVRLFGFDNSFYDGLLLNAVYLAYDEDISLPDAYVVNELYHLDGAKFSTSRNHRILGRDLLAQAPSDAVRYFLALDGPEREETNFTLERFRGTVDRHLHQATQSWLAGIGERLDTEFESTVPSTGDWLTHHRRFFHRLEELLETAATGYRPESCSLQRVASTMHELVRESRRFGRGERYWNLVEARSQEHRTGIALELLAAKVLAIMATPIMPDFGKRLWKALGLGDEGPGRGAWDNALDWVPPGVALTELGQDYFPGLAAYLES